MTTQELTLFEIRDQAAWITLNRPDARNALSGQLVNELYDLVRAGDQNPDTRCIVITGAGEAFCSGADLKNPPGQVMTDGRAVQLDELYAAIWNSTKPVIAAVNGAAFAGGLGLVGASDIVIAAQDAVFSFSEVRLGLIPAVISVVCLRKLGTHHGMRLFLTGERFNGKQAVAYGLAHKAVTADQLMPVVAAEIHTLCLGGPSALLECKRLVREVSTLSVDEGFARTRGWSLSMFESEEGREGMAAFREKRKPRWVSDQCGTDC